MTEIDGNPVEPLSTRVRAETSLTVFVTSDILYGIDEEAYDLDADPHSAILWPSSIAIAIELSELVSPGDLVLDLGAGTGLTTLMAAHLGAYPIAYDHDPFALRLIDEAARLQDLTVETREFDLHSEEELPPADLMIASDLLYDFNLARSVARHITRQVRGGGRAIIGDPGRLASSTFFESVPERWRHGDRYQVEVGLPYDREELTPVEIHILGE